MEKQAPTSEEIEFAMTPVDRGYVQHILEDSLIIDFKKEKTLQYRDNINWLICKITQQKDEQIEKLGDAIKDGERSISIFTWNSVVFSESNNYPEEVKKEIFLEKGSDGIILIDKLVTVDQLICDTNFPEELLSAYGSGFEVSFEPVEFARFESYFIYTHSIVLSYDNIVRPTPLPYQNQIQYTSRLERYRRPGDRADRSLNRRVL